MNYTGPKIREYVALIVTAPLLIVTTLYFIFKILNPDIFAKYSALFASVFLTYFGNDVLIDISKFGAISAIALIGFLKIAEIKTSRLKNF
ncbi:hypothetical protein [Methanococcus maripaludis]|uniref:Uncharacterized protein n=1 Tax=Methanococcus maripaludis TaxID=39152 RepID=A0A7J9RZA1_METMI|nr:hypothetical protein [Methanococcus maripaludis]MBB6066587.1 hypothetical protein [Methanococcus maripaludis]